MMDYELICPKCGEELVKGKCPNGCERPNNEPEVVK